MMRSTITTTTEHNIIDKSTQKRLSRYNGDVVMDSLFNYRLNFSLNALAERSRKY